jgi:hypothetical protein
MYKLIALLVIGNYLNGGDENAPQQPQQPDSNAPTMVIYTVDRTTGERRAVGPISLTQLLPATPYTPLTFLNPLYNPHNNSDNREE